MMGEFKMGIKLEEILTYMLEAKTVEDYKLFHDYYIKTFINKKKEDDESLKKKKQKEV